MTHRTRRTFVVVQARVGSVRLPGKSLLTLGGLPLAELVLRRAGNTGRPVRLATSTDSSDDPLANLVEASGFQVVRGALDDVLGRFLLATRDAAENDVVVRLTADNPVPDGAFLEGLLDYFEASNVDYVHVNQHTVPYGLSAEVFSVNALRRAGVAASDSFDREHVTPWIRRHLATGVFQPPLPKRIAPHLRCTIDTLDDFVRMSAAFQRVHHVVDIASDDLLSIMNEMMGAGPHLGTLLGAQSPLVLGAAQLGMAYGAANATGMPSDAVARTILGEAVARGVTHVDTARAYGLSETRIGRARRLDAASRLRVVTKVHPLSDYSSESSIRYAVEASVERSISELGGRESVTLAALLMHRAVDAETQGQVGWRRLREYHAEGISECIGVSVQTPDELRRASQLEDLGYVQLPFNVLDRRWLECGEELRASRPGVRIVARSVFLQGLLTSDPGVAWPCATQNEQHEITLELEQLARDLGRLGRGDLCLAYVRSFRWIDAVVIGAERVEQLLENIQLVSQQPLTESQRHTVLERLPNVPLDVLDPSRWQRTR